MLALVIGPRASRAVKPAATKHALISSEPSKPARIASAINSAVFCCPFIVDLARAVPSFMRLSGKVIAVAVAVAVAVLFMSFIISG